MNKVLQVAWREFATTVFTKGFLLGVVLTPVLILVVAGAIAWLKDFKGPRIQGVVAVIDHSGMVAEAVTRRFSPEFERKETEDAAKQAVEMIEKSPAGELAKQAAGDQLASRTTAAMQQVAESGPKLSVVVLPSDADPEKEKEPVKNAQIKVSAKGDDAGHQRLALVVIPKEAVTGDEAGKFAPLQSFFAQRLDGEVQNRIERRVEDAVVDARLAGDPRLSKAGLSPTEVRNLVKRPENDAKTLTPAGEKKALGELTMFVPMGFMILMMISIMSSGSGLLTTTVEEKSSRVMEVLLSAVSPMQLMSGKIIGQMGVGLLILFVYSGLGVGSMVFFLKRHDLITTEMIVYFVIFFIIGYFLIASMMAAIGSAVNDMREAQTFMTPVMLIVMLPWMIWFVIQRAPNSPLAVTLSFVPGMNPFIMVLRLCGSEPVPTWQVMIAILVGIASVIFAAWAAAKIFRIGVLMYGKPPNFKTLVRWVRMA